MGANGRIIYCGAFRMPERDAAAQRVLSIGRSLAASGRRVEFLAWSSEASIMPQIDLGSDFRVTVFNELRSDSDKGMLARLGQFIDRGAATVKYLKSLDLSDVEAVICYNANARFIIAVQKICRSHGIPFISDCTEWYKATDLPGGALGPVACDEFIRMHILNGRADGVIAISRYLQDFYSNKNVPTIIIPPTIDTSSYSVESQICWPDRKRPLRLCYAGNPARKDRIDIIIEAVEKALLRGVSINLQVIGPSRDQIVSLLGKRRDLLERVADQVHFTGRVPPEQVPNLLRSNHFSVLARPDERYAKAGFATKLVESMANGLPPITTTPGDEGEYVLEGINGFIAPECAPNELADAIYRAHKIGDSQWKQMSAAAQQVAVSAFDFRAYTEPLDRFLRKIAATHRPRHIA